MKKVIFGLFLFLIPMVVKAANYEITNQLIEAVVQNNGDLKVSELIVMDGTFNGYEKTLSYANPILEDNYSNYENNSLYNASDINLISIKAKYVNEVDFNTFSDSDFNDFTLVSSAYNGDIAKYTKTTNYNGYTYKLYYKANNEKVAFLITYMIKNVVVLHQDIAELYWNFISPNDYDDINNIKVKVLLPTNDNSNNFRFWAHGDLSGEIKALDNKNGVLAIIPYMDNTKTLDIRMTFDKNIITDTNSIKTTNNNALNEIINVETKRAEVANNLRDKLIRERNLVIVYSWVLLVGIFITSIYVYFKYAKSPKSNYYSKYNREFIDDYNVEVIDYLMKRQITPNALSASIMNLIYKKNINVKEISNSNSKNKNYEFSLENKDNLNSSENILIAFLFDSVGKNKVNENNKKIFTTKDLKNYASGSKTCTTFIKSYTAWKESVIDDGIAEEFFETSNKPKLFGLIILIFAVILLFLIIQFKVDFILAYIVIFIALIFFIISLAIYKKTIKGSLHHAKWNAFRNFLRDFGSFNIKELPEIILWERYLVYATIFGLASKVEKAMNVYIKEMNLENYNYDYYPTFFYLNLGPIINTSFNNAINSAYQSQAANYANTHSHRSSGSGFGGGFSSGGGFGGGGSSGHGF